MSRLSSRPHSSLIPASVLAGCLFCLRLEAVSDVLPSAAFAIVLCVLSYRFLALRACFIAFVLGFSWTGFTLMSANPHRLDERLIGTDIELVIRIDGVPVRQAGRTVFEATRLDEHVGPTHLRLSYYGYSARFDAGERWRVTVRLKPPAGLKNEGGFDRARWSIAQGLHATGYIREKPTPQRLQAASTFSPAALRQHLSEAIALLPSAGDTAPLVQALTLGLKHDVSDEQWLILRQSGTAHLLAISGLHVSLMAGWALLVGLAACRLVRRCWPQWPFSAKAGGLCLALLMATTYAMLAGFSLPTQRALIMLAVWSLASLRCRRLDATAGLGIALLAVLAIDPLAPLSVGFWLSFGTLTAIFWLQSGQGSASTVAKRDFVRRWALRLRVHVLLALALLPVTAWFFQSGSLVSPIANLVAIPFVGILIVPLSLLTMALASPAPAAADVLLQITQFLLECLLQGLDWLLVAFDGSVVATLPSIWVMALSLLAFTLVSLPKSLGLRWLAIPLILPALAFNVRGSVVEDLELHVLDVGQGLAALVLTENHTVLYDTGGRFTPSTSLFEAVIVPYLHALGRRRIDLLVVSHADDDHSAGVADAVRRFPDMEIHSSAIADGMLTPPQLCKAGDSWVMDDVRFSYLYPATGDEGSENDRSCVLLVHRGHARVLLTGDIEARGEKRLASRLQASIPVTVMTAPHHGSRTSSTQALLDAFKAEHVVIPAGLRNRWGFPHPDVKMRYKLGRAQTYVTGEGGAMRFIFDSSGLVEPPTSWLDRQSRLWHTLAAPY